MRENRLSGSEGGGIELNRFSLPLSRAASRVAVGELFVAVIWSKTMRHWALARAHRSTQEDHSMNGKTIKCVFVHRICDLVAMTIIFAMEWAG